MPSKMKTCGDYREALIDAAAGGAEPSLELRSHLDACGSCRLAFTEEQQLFAAIDTGLRVSANSAVPASLLPRVRASLGEQRITNRVWVPIAATITAMAVIVMIVFVRRTLRESPAQAPQLTSVASNIPPTKVPVVPGVGSPPESSSRTIGRKTVRQGRGTSLPQPALDTVVLVPSGQKETVDALLVGLTRGAVKSTNLIADEIEQTPQDLRVLPLVIPPIEVKPLADPSEESSPEKGKTTR
jgi:hypothetical protein